MDRISPRASCAGLLACLCAFALGGCVSSETVKLASTAHATNIATVLGQVETQREQCNAYYRQLEALQEKAHATRMVNTIVADIAANIEATSFVEAGLEIADALSFGRENFRYWMTAIEGESLEAKRAWLRSEVARLRAADPNSVRADLYEEAAARTDDELTYVHNALELRTQRTLLNARFDLLRAQVQAMEAMHGIVDEYLRIDATIDGAKIGEAIAAAEKFEISALTE